MLSQMIDLLPAPIRHLFPTPRPFHVAVGVQHIGGLPDLEELAAALVREANLNPVAGVALLQDGPDQAAAEAFMRMSIEREPFTPGDVHPEPLLVAVPLRAAMEAEDAMATSLAAGLDAVLLVEPADWVEHNEFLSAWCSAAAYRDAGGVWQVPPRRTIARWAH